MQECIFISDLPANDGTNQTIREANLDIKHKIPIGTLVEVKYDKWFGDGACEKVHARLWVIEHGRDCDGTPLYTLSTKQIDASVERVKSNMSHVMFNVTYKLKGGFGEESLTPIEVIPAIKDGHNSLEW